MFSCRSTSSCKIATCTERMKNESHPLVPRLRYAVRRGRARKVALFYTKWGNQSRRKQPRYVSGDLALLQTGTRYLANSRSLRSGWTSNRPPSVRLDEQVNSSSHSFASSPSCTVFGSPANRYRSHSIERIVHVYFSSVLCRSIETF